MKICTLVLTMALAVPATAQAGSFIAPEGCETFLTVQSRGCRVSNHYRCTADQPGDQWRADFDQEGVYFLSRIRCARREWVESYEFNPDLRQSLDAGPADPARISARFCRGGGMISISA
ncbi:MAG: hypothetical protein U5N10_18115 [Gemmobacter sp.]|nr:hypothetical protein [Gemmobacter sp.]